MRYLLSLFLAGVIGFSSIFTVEAKKLTPEEALERATATTSPTTKSLGKLKAKKAAMKLVKAVPYEKTNEEAVYLYNSTDGNGFLVLSADDRFPAVLGYSDTGSVSSDEENPAFAWWIEQYAARIGSAEDSDIPDGAEESTKAAISPLIKTKWAQRAPFYNLTPKDPATNSQSLTGCVATALSQIMYYHQHPAVGTGTIEYEY